MKYVYICALFFVLLVVVYSKGVADGKNKTTASSLQEIKTQLVAIKNSTRETLDFQRIISNNNDECFNRVWPDEVISVVNPQLR